MRKHDCRQANRAPSIHIIAKGAVTLSPYFAVNVSDEHDVQSHMFRPTIADMQDKYCGDCYDIYLIQSQYKGNHKRDGAAEGRATSFVIAAKGRHLCILALNKVNIVAVTTILVLPVGNGRSAHV